MTYTAVQVVSPQAVPGRTLALYRFRMSPRRPYSWRHSRGRTQLSVGQPDWLPEWLP